MNIPAEFTPWYTLLANQHGATITASYQELLTLDGVVFPDEQLLEADRLWSAHTARLQGSTPLSAEGSPVDLSGFDETAVSLQLRRGRTAFANITKLTSLVEFSLISRAAGATAIDIESEDHQSTTEDETQRATDAIRAYRQDFKHFVQTGMAIEEWEVPWQELVHHGFAGNSLQFPLDANGIHYAAHRFAQFRLIGREHFQKADALRFAIRGNLGLSPILETAPNRQHNIAAFIGMFYRTSTEGTKDYINTLITNDRLAANINWQEEIETAVTRAARIL